MQYSDTAILPGHHLTYSNDYLQPAEYDCARFTFLGYDCSQCRNNNNEHDFDYSKAYNCA